MLHNAVLLVNMILIFLASKADGQNRISPAVKKSQFPFA
jgi:hypothetical protein